MRFHTPLVVALALAALADASPVVSHANNDDPVARWKGRAHTAEQLAEAFGDELPDTLALWAPWAKEHGYDFHVEPQGRVVLLLADDARGVSKELALAEKTADAVDELFRLAEGAAVPEPYFKAPALIVNARDEAEYGLVLDHAATLEPSLAGWVEHGKRLTGFTLVKPLASGWAERAKGRVEWNPENELVHRVTALLTLKRFGELPYWLLCGVSWHVEIEQCKDVYCFPYRSEFVYAVEHTAWPKALQALFKDPREPFLPGLVAWQRGTFDGDRGKEAWGFARFAAEVEGALPAILADLSALRRKEGVRHFDDGRWELIVGWEPSVAQQRAIFAQHLGEDFEARAVESFRDRAGKVKKGARRP